MLCSTIIFTSHMYKNIYLYNVSICCWKCGKFLHKWFNFIRIPSHKNIYYSSRITQCICIMKRNQRNHFIRITDLIKKIFRLKIIFILKKCLGSIYLTLKQFSRTVKNFNAYNFLNKSEVTTHMILIIPKNNISVSYFDVFVFYCAQLFHVLILCNTKSATLFKNTLL